MEKEITHATPITKLISPVIIDMQWKEKVISIEEQKEAGDIE